MHDYEELVDYKDFERSEIEEYIHELEEEIEYIIYEYSYLRSIGDDRVRMIEEDIEELKEFLKTK